MFEVEIETSAESAFWQTIACAFMPPMDVAVALSFVSDLADDLSDLSDALGIEAEADVAALRDATARHADPAALLWEYSRLFLPPAEVVTLNLSRYVDSGGVGGPCMDALELAYAAHDLEPSERLHDFADHAARQFEFLGYLAGRDDEHAGAFAQLCLVGALPQLAARLGQSAPDSPYTALAAVAAKALRRCYGQHGAETAPSNPNRRHDLTLGVWRHCSDCGEPYAREKEISIMTAALERAGLPAAHLAKCPNCRDRAQGFFRREIA